jgi:hypothetical protein
MTSHSAASAVRIAHAADITARIEPAGHHYHGAFRIALAVFALLVIAGVVVLVTRRRRPAGPSRFGWRHSASR